MVWRCAAAVRNCRKNPAKILTIPFFGPCPIPFTKYGARLSFLLAFCVAPPIRPHRSRKQSPRGTRQQTSNTHAPGLPLPLSYTAPGSTARSVHVTVLYQPRIMAILRGEERKSRVRGRGVGVAIYPVLTVPCTAVSRRRRLIVPVVLFLQEAAINIGEIERAECSHSRMIYPLDASVVGRAKAVLVQHMHLCPVCYFAGDSGTAAQGHPSWLDCWRVVHSPASSVT